jgi:hypothetical protein
MSSMENMKSTQNMGPSQKTTQKLPPKDVTPPPPKAIPAEQRPLAKREERVVERKVIKHVHVRGRRKEKEKPEHGAGYYIGMYGIILGFAGLLVWGGVTFLKRRAAPPPEPEIVEVVKYLPPPPPKVEPKPEPKVELKAEAPKPPPLPPQPPEPPPSPWTALYRGPDNKATLRLSVDKDGVKGFYSPPNWMYAAADLERGEVKGDLLTASVVLGTRRYGLRAERDGDTITVFKWVDPDGLRDEYRLVEVAFAQGRINIQQALLARQQIQAAMKTAGPEHAKNVGAWVREDAPKMVTQPRRGR